ncbi:Ail/Lom family outer membrane beta-barrel protein [Erwinia billingiae]|uniref:Ail/Lom family outer membrane beta-barrel protein n=1 Tax=Erwinia billingiae TaxID=182337 RepID=UPI000D001031|nr:Ail/Lom family outer membrane beta-barrel protein [Erwinia billingiae]PRB59436.1 Ail/Lom family protein [Erwinia billingiae]
MKTTILSLAILTAISTVTVVHAADHTITLGYAQSKVQDFKNIQGINAKYRYEWNSPLSIISSFTYLNGSSDGHYSNVNNTIYPDVDVKYYSLAVGPAYRINDFFSLYGLVGVNYNKVNYSYDLEKFGLGNSSSTSDNKSTNLMYGAGVQINPWNNLAIDVGYEGSRVKDGGTDYAVNGFNVGVGYRF